jgi:aerobic carbon-monoxide dehydrogenase small subunit
LTQIAITVNGARRELEVEPRELLVYVLRERLGLTGTNVGCDTSQCGACTVHLNGKPVKACTLLGVQADEGSITTIEGLATNGALHPVQEAFRDAHGLQCGFCTPGMIMTAVSLIDSGEDLSDEAIRHGLEGNLCRCTGYENIVRAIRAAADEATHEVAR